MTGKRALAGVYVFAASAALACSAALADAPRRLDERGSLCDPERVFCIRGSLTHYPDSRVIELTGRVATAPGPGWVSIVLRGTSRRNQPASTIMEFPVRGAWSEIVDVTFIPDQTEVTSWRFERLYFEPDEAAEAAARERD